MEKITEIQTLSGNDQVQVSRRRFIQKSGGGVLFFGIGVATIGTAAATSHANKSATITKNAHTVIGNPPGTYDHTVIYDIKNTGSVGITDGKVFVTLEVFNDQNSNGKWDEGEPKTTVLTDHELADFSLGAGLETGDVQKTYEATIPSGYTHARATLEIKSGGTSLDSDTDESLLAD